MHTAKVIIDEEEYLSLVSTREATEQQIAHLAEKRAKELIREENKVEIRVDIYAEGRSGGWEDKVCLSVQPQPYCSIKEDLKPLAQKVCYIIEDQVSYLLERDKHDAIARRRAYEYGIQNARLWVTVGALSVALILSVLF